MNRTLSLFLLSVLMICFGACDLATLQGVEEEVFQLSSDDTGYEYEITVLLPPDYDDSQTYPSVYLLDGHWHYPHAAADAQRMMAAGEIEPILLIGIAYANIPPNTLGGFGTISDIRVDDFTFPKNTEDAENGGKAFAFRDFIAQDLIPEIESRYPTGANERTLMGHSLGGYFGIWEMLTFPDRSLFENIESGSPALWWADGYLMEQEEELNEAGTPLPFRLHTTMGSLESVVWNTFFDEFEARLLEHQPAGLDLKVERFPRGHAANAEIGYSQGLLHFFGQ
ncbi:MAG: alpha/beta hydrolase-fold protein [Bacteroidota bacterium]